MCSLAGEMRRECWDTSRGTDLWPDHNNDGKAAPVAGSLCVKGLLELAFSLAACLKQQSYLSKRRTQV